MGNELYCEQLTEYGCCKLKEKPGQFGTMCEIYKTPELCELIEIPMTAVVSSNIRAVGWVRGVLRILFAKRTKYEYFGVPKALALELIGSKSVGKLFYEKVAKKFEFKQKED